MIFAAGGNERDTAAINMLIEAAYESEEEQDIEDALKLATTDTTLKVRQTAIAGFVSIDLDLPTASISNDPSHVIRQLSLLNLQVDKSNVNHVISRTRDIHPGVRQAAYVALSRTDNFDMISLLDSAILDRDSTVKEYAIKLILKRFTNVLQVVDAIGGYSSSKLPSILPIALKKLGFDGFNGDYTHNSVAILRNWLEILKSNHLDYDALLPTHKKHISSMETCFNLIAGDGEDQGDESKLFVLKELLEIGLGNMDYTDEYSRHEALKFLKFMIVNMVYLHLI